MTGTVYVVWSDLKNVWLARSTDHGVSFSSPVRVSSIATTVMPWAAAYGGKLDVVYYGSTATSIDDPAAVWNDYDTQSLDGGQTFTQALVSDVPNHLGAICTGGLGCANSLVTQTLLDLFKEAENPLTGKATIVFTNDTLDSFTSNFMIYILPEVLLAQEQ